MRLLLALLLTAVAAGEEAWVIGSDGVHHTVLRPEVLTRPIHFAQTVEAGLQATFFASSMGGILEDDWRQTQRSTGTRRDARIDQPRSAFGTRAERQRFAIGGTDRDWDAFAVQWDGMIRIPPGGADLATSSDDGSRVWIDRNRDGQCQEDEWGGNGWGEGQGTTRRTTQTALPAGDWPIRVQYNEYGLANACVLEWRLSGSERWLTVPDAAFARIPVLRLEGPVSVRSVFSGAGELHCADGVGLASLPVGPVMVVGQARLAADLEGGRFPFAIAPEATLDLAGHALRIAGIDGGGTVALAGGTLAVERAPLLAVRGPGQLAVSGDLVLADLDPDVTVVLAPGAAVRSPRRSVVTALLVAPLATVLELHPVPASASMLEVELDGPLAGAGLVAWRADRHGRWFQRLAAPRLIDGRQRLTIDLSATAPLAPMRHDGAWNAATAGESPRAGLLIYADRPLSGRVTADACWQPAAQQAQAPHLTVLTAAPTRIRTGQRVALGVMPHPFPSAPMDPEVFALELEVSGPDGATTRFAGFADQPFRRLDRGDREVLTEDGPPRFSVRWRARQAGLHRLRLTAMWDGGAGRATAELPAVLAEGPDWDDIARVDASDPRFLSSQGALVWPIGHNLHSTYDVRSRQRLSTQLTVDRGSFVRETLLARLAAAGGTGTEVWMSPWNLGLEWIDTWPGFHGTGRPNLGNAWALDRLLDQAEGLGMRVVLTIFNHGMGRQGDRPEQDWRHHPWNVAHGGWLEVPAGLFTDPQALRRQAHYFRYLAARWGDSPAVLAWKLWAEVDLTDAEKPVKAAWHERAAALMARHDPWRHPVTTHWCSTWRNADPAIAALPGISMLTIDAYHGADVLIADLMAQSTLDPRRPNDGLARYGKPVLVAEYGGNWDASPGQRMQAQLAVGGWAALTHGHAGMPMLWWFEWIDQGGHYAPFGALRRFIAGEDLRGTQAKTIIPTARDGSATLWCRAWQRPGRMLGYLLDPEWGRSGGEGRPLSSSILDFGEVKAGALRVAWWDADAGLELSVTTIDHPGGALRLSAPTFQRHLAFKLWRTGEPPSTM